MFSLPNFNLDVSIWHWPTNPVGNPPDLTVKGNLAYSKRVQPGSTISATESGNHLAFLLVPKGTDVRTETQTGPASPDRAEVPTGSGRYYYVFHVEDVGKGFLNEHRCAVIYQTADFGSWPIPMP